MSRNWISWSVGIASCAAAVLVPAGVVVAQARPATSLPGRVVTPAAPDRDGKLKVVLYHDMEGLSGQADRETYRFSNPQYAYGRELLMADVNAAIDGLFAGGADSVFIVDGHGSGNIEPDILTEKLDPRAKQIFRDQPFGAYSAPPVLSDLVPPGTYDAVALVGSHGKSGGQGFAAHTTSPNMLPFLNGASITEAENLALAWGRQGVPLIFVSGDDQLQEEIRESLPWIEFVVTKKSRNNAVIELLPVDRVRAEIREKARLAMSQWKEMKAVTLTMPIRAGFKVLAPLTLEPLRGIPGVTFDGDMIAFTTTDFRAANEAFIRLIMLAGQLRTTGERPWPPPPGKRGYHGAR
jgi:D-amino peptidase